MLIVSATEFKELSEISLRLMNIDRNYPVLFRWIFKKRVELLPDQNLRPPVEGRQQNLKILRSK